MRIQSTIALICLGLACISSIPSYGQKYSPEISFDSWVCTLVNAAADVKILLNESRTRLNTNSQVSLPPNGSWQSSYDLAAASINTWLRLLAKDSRELTEEKKFSNIEKFYDAVSKTSSNRQARLAYQNYIKFVAWVQFIRRTLSDAVIAS